MTRASNIYIKMGCVAMFRISDFVGIFPGVLLNGISLEQASDGGIQSFSMHSIRQLARNSFIRSVLQLSTFWFNRSHPGAFAFPQNDMSFTDYLSYSFSYSVSLCLFCPSFRFLWLSWYNFLASWFKILSISFFSSITYPSS